MSSLSLSLELTCGRAFDTKLEDSPNLPKLIEARGPGKRVEARVRVPDFSLTNQQRQPLSLSDMAGKIWIADFIFTNCPTICPAMTQEMARLQSEFVADPVYFVSFSVDPERDTTEVLTRYAKAYGADERRWHFLTGNKGDIYQLAEQGFSLAAGHNGTEILHSSRFVLIKPDGNIYDTYDSQDEAAMLRLRRDVKTLLKK